MGYSPWGHTESDMTERAYIPFLREIHPNGPFN